jgi:hypothetical protein
MIYRIVEIEYKARKSVCIWDSVFIMKTWMQPNNHLAAVNQKVNTPLCVTKLQQKERKLWNNQGQQNMYLMTLDTRLFKHTEEADEN